MTIKEYIEKQLAAFHPTDADIIDVFLYDTTISEGDEYSESNAEQVSKMLALALPSFILKPRLNDVSEGGFSMSWNFDNLVKYYLWLCRKHGLTPDATVMETSGISVIIDKTDIW